MKRCSIPISLLYVFLIAKMFDAHVIGKEERLIISYNLSVVDHCLFARHVIVLSV